MNLASRIVTDERGNRVRRVMIERVGRPRDLGTEFQYGWAVDPLVLDRVLHTGQQLAHGLNVKTVKVRQSAGVVYVCIPNAEAPGVVTFAEAWGQGVPQNCLLLGVSRDPDEGIIQWYVNLVESGPHSGYFGQTKSGKTNGMTVAALSALLHGLRVVLMTPILDHSDPFEALAQHPNVLGGRVFRWPDEIGAVLHRLAANIERNPEPLYIFIDEVALLTDRCPSAKDDISTLAQSGRHGGIHLILGTQHPLTDSIGQGAMTNINVRVVGKVASPVAAYHCAGIRDTGAERLMGNGDMLAIKGGDVVRFQAPYLDETTLQEIAAEFAAMPRVAAVYKPVPAPSKPVREPADIQPERKWTPRKSEIVVAWIVRETLKNPSLQTPSLRAIGRHVEWRWPWYGKIGRPKAQEHLEQAEAILRGKWGWE